MSGLPSDRVIGWLALAMVATGAILIAVSWHPTMVGRHTPARNETVTVAQISAQGPLPTAAEPLIPTRASVPSPQAGLLPQPQAGLSSATATPVHRGTGTIFPRDTPVGAVGSIATATPVSPSAGARHLQSGGDTFSPGSPPPPVSPAAGPDAHRIRERFGVGVAIPSLDELDPSGQLGAGWYLNWNTALHPSRPRSMEFVQMIRVHEGRSPDLATIAAAAGANPGSLWLIGNEPDVAWQDNATPDQYAQVYHQLYTFLKARDASCRVAIGGVSQPTPLRLRYLDMILDSYEHLYGERMPVDVWNVHAFILREESDSWGVAIPPGLPAAGGTEYEIQDHDDLQIFAQQVMTFRRWMRDRGARAKPLVVSEYGILMPGDFGFGPERVRAFMYSTFSYLLNARDDELGYPPDDNRLVQRWAWYSLADTRYPTGNLIDPETKELTSLGVAYREFVSARE
jgi:hypothetical protein